MASMDREQLTEVVRQQIAGYHDGDGTGAEAVMAALEATQPDHIVEFRPDRWAVRHSMACRLAGTLLDCKYHQAIATIAVTGVDTDDFGRWRITSIDSEGLPALERIEGTANG